MAEKRVKTTSMADEDRISKLPNTLIIHILSFLPTPDAVRTCFLSKRWKLMWYSVPTISFCDSDCHFTNEGDWPEKFCKFVDNCLEQRKRGMYFISDSNITSFKFMIDDFETSDFYSCVDKWLAFGVQNKIKEIRLQLLDYCLPMSVVNARYLTILELEGSDLDTSYSIRLPALKTLLLDRVGFKQNDGMFKFVLGCPSLEKLMVLNLVHQLRLQSTSLKFIQLGYRANIEPIQIEAINLESLILNGFIFENSNLSACKAIKNLSIVLAEYSFEDPSSLEDLISYFPLLENLTLDCDELTLENIKISNQQLRSLNLENCGYYFETDYRMVNVTVSAPKLTSFCYKGNISLSIVVESSDLLNGELVILDRPKKYDANWFTRMMNFLQSLNCSWNIVTLHISSDMVLILPENFKRICRSSLMTWKHLKVITKEKPTKESELIDSLRWISPTLETLSINEKDIF